VPRVRRARALVAGWAFALALIAAFASLGLWQLRRGDAKQQMLERSAAVLEHRRAVSLAAARDTAQADHYDWAAGRGRFVPRPPLLLDNQQREGRVGVRVFRLFQPDSGGALLVDLGWLPLPGDRSLPAPASSMPDGSIEVRGLLAPPPSAGLAVGEPMALRNAGPDARTPVWLATRIELDAVERAIGDPQRPLAPRVLRLDPVLPIGFERDLELLPNTLPPEKHRGYAVQWFGLALAVLVTASILTFRSFRR
jgi:surfeit locus 1 family protein